MFRLFVRVVVKVKNVPAPHRWAVDLLVVAVAFAIAVSPLVAVVSMRAQ